MHDGVDADGLVREIQAVHQRICAQQRELFALLAEAERREVWRDSGARDMTQWVSITQGVSAWKAARWMAAARALEGLPAVSDAMEGGTLGIDKVVELTRFATGETERGLVAWAQRVSTWAIRRKADVEARRSDHDVVDVERSRSLSWWFFDEGRRFGMEAELPAAGGVAGADEAGRATVVVHAPLSVLERDDGASEIDGGGIAPVQTTRRLLCNARVQVLVEDEHAHPVRVGRLRRDPPAWMMRQLRYRDRECTFPGCGARRFTQAHHVVWWERGGTTDLDNLILVCGYHHKLVHELGWTVWRGADRSSWFRPDGTAFTTGADPPAVRVA